MFKLKCVMEIMGGIMLITLPEPMTTTTGFFLIVDGISRLKNDNK